MKHSGSPIQWILPLSLSVVILFSVILYAVSYHQTELNKQSTTLIQLEKQMSTQLEDFFTIVNNGTEVISQKLVLYDKMPNHQRLGELHDITRTMVNLHGLITQIIIISSDGKPITSSDLLNVPFEKYPHKDWIDYLSNVTDMQISSPVISLYGISHSEKIMMIGKNVKDLRGKTIGFIIFTIYPDSLFPNRFHLNLLPVGTVHLIHQNGTQIAAAGAEICEDKVLNTTSLHGGQLTMRSHVKPLDFTINIFNLDGMIILGGIILSILMMTTGIIIRRTHQKEQELYVKDLEVEVKNRTQELAIKNEQLEEAQKISKLGSWSLDLIENKLIWSDEIFNIFEIDKTKFEASYDGFLNAIHPDDRGMVNDAYTNSLEDKQLYSIKHRLLMDDGRVKWVQEMCKTDFDNKGNPLMSTGTVQDITEQELLKIENENNSKLLSQQSKMAALGEMIGNISHQWRQPLSVISTGSTGLKMQKECNTLTDEEFIKTCDVINDNAQYLSKTIDDFRDFIKGERKIVEFNLNDNVESFLHLVEGTIKNNDINIIKNIQEDIKIKSYPNELIQCFINIFNNAKDALKNIDGERLLLITVYLKDDKVMISFKDNAGGILENIISRIFEPYFTTKHQSQGTGLGLHMTYSLIVEGMKGTIEAGNITFEHESQKYKGAEFIISLPLSIEETDETNK